MTVLGIFYLGRQKCPAHLVVEARVVGRVVVFAVAISTCALRQGQCGFIGSAVEAEDSLSQGAVVGAPALQVLPAEMAWQAVANEPISIVGGERPTAGSVMRIRLPRGRPCRPSSPVSRPKVHRATGMPLRLRPAKAFQLRQPGPPGSVDAVVLRVHLHDVHIQDVHFQLLVAHRPGDRPSATAS